VLSEFDHAYLNEIAPFDVLSPTAENLARVVFDRMVDTVGEQVKVKEIVVWESPIAKIVYRR
jgi:6-pyruvoyltetrahydropterin/6-carboxytetrahydropterin synthase